MSKPAGPSGGRDVRIRRVATAGLVAVIAVVLTTVLVVAHGAPSSTPTASPPSASPPSASLPSTDHTSTNPGEPTGALTEGTPAPSAETTANKAPHLQPGQHFKPKPGPPPGGQEGGVPPGLLDAVRRVLGPTGFRVSSFNVLGHGHTAKGGNRRGWAPSGARMGGTVDLLDGSGASVVGFQEFQIEQVREFSGRTNGAWSVFPGASMGTRVTTHNSIAWRNDTWELVETHTIGIPYFGGARVPMPYVLLKHRSSGERVWFANFHNPANAHGPAQRWRNVAVARETALARNLHAGGIPVIVTGDFNDREQVFCPMTRNAPLQAANGGSTGGRCHPPSPMLVDWIFGSTDLVFSNYNAISQGVVGRVSDHPFVFADVSLE